MNPTREAFEALMPKVAFCRVGDVLGPTAPMCGQTENAKLYTADQMRQMFEAATERAAKICEQHATTLTNAGIRGHETAEECAAAIRGGDGGAHV